MATTPSSQQGASQGAYTYQPKNGTAMNCTKGVDNTDKSILAALWEGLTAGIAAYNTGQAIDFALKQYDIAKDYLRISEWWNDYYKTNFAPLENQEILEALGLSEPTPKYDVQIGRAQTAGRIKFKNSINKNVQCTSEYCSGLRQQILYDTIVQEAQTVAVTAGLGYRNERAEMEKRSDVRWKRMINTVQRGRGLQADAVNSAGLAYGIYGNLGQQAAKGAEGAAMAAGYLFNRNDTHYATLMRADPLAAPRAQQQSSVQITSGYIVNAAGIPTPATNAQMGGGQ